jgi:hypothetical protein
MYWRYVRLVPIGLRATIGTSEFDVPGTEAAVDVSLAIPAGCARMTASDFVCWGQPFGGVTPVHIE